MRAHTALPIAPAVALPHSPQAGDRVVYSKFAGTDVQVAGDEHVLLKVGLAPHAAGCCAGWASSAVWLRHVLLGPVVPAPGTRVTAVMRICVHAMPPIDHRLPGGGRDWHHAFG